MKNIKMKTIAKRLIFLSIAIYFIYTIFTQQKILNVYKADENRYLTQIAEEKEKKEKLNNTKRNIDSKEYIEEVAREKLDMYLPNEKVYIDRNK